MGKVIVVKDRNHETKWAHVWDYCTCKLVMLDLEIYF